MLHRNSEFAIERRRARQRQEIVKAERRYRDLFGDAKEIRFHNCVIMQNVPDAELEKFGIRIERRSRTVSITP